MQSLKMSKADRFVNFLAKQIKENRTRFFTVIGFTLGVIMLSGFVFIRLQTLKESSSDRLAAAYMYLRSGNQQQAAAHLNNAIIYSGNTPAAYQARLVKADMMIENKDYTNALLLLKETEEKGVPELIKPLALSRIIYLYDQQKDYSNAILYSNEFINKYSDSFLIKDVYIGLARYYLLTNSQEDAKNVYNEILIKFPATREAEYAAAFLQEEK
ncbi:MAG: tetratricopeptide repeat protein [Endomicrobium sp.]|nr:tetratricopeptide repeat protein [Endomicrobium sp.]